MSSHHHNLHQSRQLTKDKYLLTTPTEAAYHGVLPLNPPERIPDRNIFGEDPKDELKKIYEMDQAKMDQEEEDANEEMESEDMGSIDFEAQLRREIIKDVTERVNSLEAKI
jgi:hypothetical protein